MHPVVQSAAYATARLPAPTHRTHSAEKLAAGTLGPLRSCGAMRA